MSCHASYRAGRIRSFIAASTTANRFAPLCLRYSTRVSNTPALPTMERPGSSISTISPAREPFRDGPGQRGRLRRILVAVADAEAAPEVEVRETDAVPGQRVDEREQAIEGIEEGFEGRELGADVAVDAAHLQRRTCGGPGIEPSHVAGGNPELVLVEARW